MNPADKIKNILMNDIHEMASHPECFTKHPDKDFTRNRKLSTEDVLLFPIIMERDSVPRELLKYFDYSTSTPSASAYYQQRSKLAPDTYRQLLFTFNRHFSPSLYKGKYILMAVDGSGFSIFATLLMQKPTILPLASPDGGSTKFMSLLHTVSLTGFILMQSYSPPKKK